MPRFSPVSASSNATQIQSYFRGEKKLFENVRGKWMEKSGTCAWKWHTQLLRVTIKRWKREQYVFDVCLGCCWLNPTHKAAKRKYRFIHFLSTFSTDSKLAKKKNPIWFWILSQNICSAPAWQRQRCSYSSWMDLSRSLTRSSHCVIHIQHLPSWVFDLREKRGKKNSPGSDLQLPKVCPLLHKLGRQVGQGQGSRTQLYRGRLVWEEVVSTDASCEAKSPGSS